MANSMAITTLLYDPPNENDPPKVKSAKTFNFLHEIFDGPSALIDTFNSLKEHNRIRVEIEKTVRKHYLSHKLTPTEESDFQEAQTCNLCLKSLEKNPEQKSKRKVRNHCHNTGKYLGAVHSRCSTQYKDDSPHVILAHNF